ncbi:MAG: MATE family efflux transporter [Lachnospiraceae bacterium]|nr:MATE family efflux transporter [Lachnospiraceae bacterium]
MSSRSNKIYLLKEEKVSTALLKLGIPTMIGMMVSALYNLVDAFFVGKLGTPQIGAVSVVYPLGVVLLGIGLLFGAGASSYLSRLLGNKSYTEASECASTALITSVVMGIAVIVLMIKFLEPILIILGATKTILPYAKEYAFIFVVGLVFNVFNITLNNIITSEGASIISMTAMLSGGVANIIFDPLLIFGFSMGVKGAAIATLIARIISFVIYLTYLLSGNSVFKFKLRNFKPSIKVYSEILKIGIPMLVFQLLSSITFGITNSLAGVYGDEAVAALGIVTRIMNLFCMMIFGFLKGYQPFVGYNLGAKNYQRVEDATKTALKWGFAFCISTAMILILFRIPIMRSFSTQDETVVIIGAKAIIANALVFIGMAYQVLHGTRFLAFGKAKQGGLISIGRQGAFFIPIVFIFTAMFKLNGLILAQPISDICSILMVVILVKCEKQEDTNILISLKNKI